VVVLVQVVSASDIALYGGLTALASFDRSELRSQVINNIAFREFLELYPEVRGGSEAYTSLHNIQSLHNISII
jgi:hypothetical protein